jgi:hypothetical protein
MLQVFLLAGLEQTQSVIDSVWAHTVCLPCNDYDGSASHHLSMSGELNAIPLDLCTRCSGPVQ